MSPLHPDYIRQQRAEALERNMAKLSEELDRLQAEKLRSVVEFPPDVIDRECWLSRAGRAHKFSDVACGVAYHWELNSRGADFFLFLEPGIALDDIEDAADKLRRSRDATSVYWVDLT